MPFGLLKYGLSYPAKRHFAPPGWLKPSHDAVITDSAAARYTWSCVLHAMAEFGGAAAGRAALRGLNQGS